MTDMPFVRAVKAFNFREEPVAEGTIMAKSDFHEEYHWRNLVDHGYLVEQMNGHAGKLSDKRSVENPKD